MEIRTEQKAIREVVRGMAKAWNSGEGAAFASYCEEDADFVNIHGLHARGRQAIAAGHNQIFRTVYAGSTLQYRVARVRFLCEKIALVHVRAHLEVPEGPMSRELNSVPTMVMRHSELGWSVAAFHNTLIGELPGKH